MSFSQALSGLRAQAENIKVISNNIANSQTVGFKTGNVLFADVFAGAGQVGLGVNVVGVQQDFRSGDLENTGRNLDLAIAGQGFYRLEKANGEVVYSRNGEFNQDQNGYLINGTGQFLTGYGLSDPNDPFSEVIAGGAPQRLQIPPDDIPANATEDASALYNLNATTNIHAPAAVPPIIDPNIQTASVVANPNATPPIPGDIQFHFSSSYTIYDSLGNERTVTSYFTKSDVNTWDVVIALDGYRANADFTTPGTPGTPGDPGPPVVLPTPVVPASGATPDFTLNFTADGQLDVDGTPITAGGNTIGVAISADNNAAIDLTFAASPDPTANPLVGFDLGGAAGLGFTLDLRGSTQFNNNSVMNQFGQDGYTSGTLIGLEVLDDGRVVRIFTNEERRDAGQIVLTNFINPEGLQPDGDNAWRQTNASGQPVLGVAGTGIFGTIEGGMLENSNVDLAQQLVDMIVSQRAYQANSSSIGTQDEMLQTVINL